MIIFEEAPGLPHGGRALTSSENAAFRPAHDRRFTTAVTPLSVDLGDIDRIPARIRSISPRSTEEGSGQRLPGPTRELRGARGPPRRRRRRPGPGSDDALGAGRHRDPSPTRQGTGAPSTPPPSAPLFPQNTGSADHRQGRTADPGADASGHRSAAPALNGPISTAHETWRRYPTTGTGATSFQRPCSVPRLTPRRPRAAGRRRRGCGRRRPGQCGRPGTSTCSAAAPARGSRPRRGCRSASSRRR